MQDEIRIRSQHEAQAASFQPPLAERLVGAWQKSLEGDAGARDEWHRAEEEGGVWEWQKAGLHLRSSGPQWPGMVWRNWAQASSGDKQNILVELKVSGKGDAAGFSFGPFKDFMVELDAQQERTRHLQLEIDEKAATWAFRVDGRLLKSCWWNTQVRGVEDILSGMFTLKAKRPREVLFHDLSVRRFESSCRLSVVLTCYRFLQRLRLSLRNWCHQDLPTGACELLVVNPHSPDGTHDHLAAVARAFPQVRMREIEVGPELVTNKGAMINRAFQMSRGEWIWLADADCLFPPDSAADVLRQLEGRPRHLFYGERYFLSSAQTDALLGGRADSLRDLAELRAAARGPESAPWGYTQIVHRSIFQRIRYREGINHFAHSDGHFIEDCRRHQVTPKQLDGLYCLHMDHPFAWYGTNAFL